MLRNILLTSFMIMGLLSPVNAEEVIIPQSSALTFKGQTQGVYTFTGEQELTGLLKARWGKDLTNDNQPKIYLQFFPELKQAELLPKINDQYKDSNQTINLNTKASQQDNIQLVRGVFKNAPQNFWEHKEGVLEQPVKITINEFTAASDCDYRYYYGDIVELFTINSIAETIEEKTQGCDNYIFETTFLIQSKEGYTNLRAKPNSKADIVKQLPNNTIVRKIKTDGNWYYVEELEAGESTNTLGYVHKSQVVEAD